tara:strand:+ start:3889 stop:4056 length:168 start_codon:yes stop_codon:yes gene_type:complete
MKDLVESLLAQTLLIPRDPTFRGCKACSLKNVAHKAEQKKALLRKEERALQHNPK